MDKFTKKLLNNIYLNYNEKHKSSHWIKYTKDFNCNNGIISGISGFSKATKKLPLLGLYHKILQKLNFNNIDFSFDKFWYKTAYSAMSKQERIVDSCVLRQVLTLELLEEKINLNNINNICVIGDGQSNFVAIALESKKFKKVLSINLPEVLLNDFYLIKKMGFPLNKIALLETKNQVQNFLNNENIKFGMIEANNANIIFEKQIDLFINIASFGEMNLDVVSNYFKIIKSSIHGTYLYSCNREKKELPDGTITMEKDYPWKGFTKKILDEKAPWHLTYYILRRGLIPIPKIKIPFDGPIIHKLLFYPPVKNK